MMFVVEVRIKDKPCSELSLLAAPDSVGHIRLCFACPDGLAEIKAHEPVSAPAEKSCLGLELWFSCKIPYALLRSESFQLL